MYSGRCSRHVALCLFVGLFGVSSVDGEQLMELFLGWGISLTSSCSMRIHFSCCFIVRTWSTLDFICIYYIYIDICLSYLLILQICFFCIHPWSLTKPMKNHGWKTTFLWGRAIFRGYVKLQECMCIYIYLFFSCTNIQIYIISRVIYFSPDPGIKVNKWFGGWGWE